VVENIRGRKSPCGVRILNPGNP